jgi:hypothetical protein
MKLAVLTLHRCINYGSYWQARCLLDGLAERGHTVVLLDARSQRADRAEWRCALAPTLPTPVAAADRPLYALKLRRFGQAWAGLPRSRPFALHDAAAMERFDAVVVGSDEVWNLHHPWYAAQPLFFGEGLRAARRIAYAASAGHYPAAQGLPPEWAQRLRGFDSVAVRDANSQALLTHALGHAPARVLDPCLQFMGSLPGGEEGLQIDPSYALVYGHNFSGGFAAQARAWARRHGLRLLSLGYRNDWAHTQWLSAGPQAFVDAMAQAQAVFTNFFHGAVFALRLRRPWACELSAYRAIKLQDLLASLDAQAHCLREDDAPARLDALLEAPAAAGVQARLMQAREASARWLDAALQAPPTKRHTDPAPPPALPALGWGTARA